MMMIVMKRFRSIFAMALLIVAGNGAACSEQTSTEPGHQEQSLENPQHGGTVGKYRDTFETERLIIRRGQASDATDLQRYGIYKNGTGFEVWEQWPTEIDVYRTMAAEAAKNTAAWHVERKADSRMIGFVSFNEVKDRLLDFGHGFTHPLTRRDEVAEALEVMIQHAFDTLDIDAVDARNEKAWTDNTAPLFTLGFVELEDKMQMTRAKWAARKKKT